MKFWSKFVIVFDIVCWGYVIINFYILWPSIKDYYYNSNDQEAVVVQSEPIDLGIQFDFCGEVDEASDPIAQLNAGTPIPYQPVIMSTVVPGPTLIPEPLIFSTPPPAPAVSPTPSTELTRSPLEVVSVGNYQVDNYHIVFVPVGYDDAYIFGEMPGLIWNIGTNFSQIKVDFAYVNVSIEYGFEHVQQSVDFESVADKKKLFAEIKKVYPADGIVVLLNTPEYLGTRIGNFSILSGSDPDTKLIATHEIGHMLSLDDGYQLIYPKGHLPNSELFYIDRMPSKLISALEQMNTWPDMYKVGNCRGKAVYSFYESNNNVMRDYSPSGTSSWGVSTFTPLQIILMNDYVSWFKGSN